jgi:hypothetical protein
LKYQPLQWKIVFISSVPAFGDNIHHDIHPFITMLGAITQQKMISRDRRAWRC